MAQAGLETGARPCRCEFSPQRRITISHTESFQSKKLFHIIPTLIESNVSSHVPPQDTALLVVAGWCRLSAMTGTGHWLTMLG